MRVRTVVMPPATMRVVSSLDTSAARDPPDTTIESARELFAKGA
jgi:hypothetical protein